MDADPPKAYLGKRARAILQVAAGEPIEQVVQPARIRVHRATVSAWVQRYLAEGIEGLKVKPGRGRKPAFSPLGQVETEAQVATLLHQSPRQYGLKQTGWRLQDLGRALAWLKGYREAGICKVLKRLGFSRKQALNFIGSPDPDYRAKWQAISQAFQEAVEQPEWVVILFLDELTYRLIACDGKCRNYQDHGTGGAPL
ncbi:MAG: helix-turn-helix domain containing protein [Chloroflexi bacterium]|nr:helix-turn-helix domain containing protein [Chloroflexota bacterium]